MARYWLHSLIVSLIPETWDNQSCQRRFKAARSNRFIHTAPCVWGKWLEIYFRGTHGCPWSGTEGQKENVRLLPSIQILPGILSSDKPLTGSSEAFTSFKGASVPDNSVRRRGRRNVARGKRGGRPESGQGDANRWWDDKHFSSQTLPELFSH